jgi:hypothetical protein
MNFRSLIKAETAVVSVIENVPLIEVGMDFPVSTGIITVTEEDLLDVVEALGDPAIKSPRIKLGHGDSAFGVDQTDPAMPAFGTITSMRYEPEDMTLYGDLEMPKWLAEIAPLAYPNRSFEGWQNAETATGKKWRLVVTAISLLGVSWPGISTLDDLKAAFSPNGPEGVEVNTIAAALIRAQANCDDVRREFMDQVAVGDQYWWWIRAMLIDPNELIVDDDEGQLYRMSYAIATNGDVTFGDPQEVKIKYVDAPKKKAAEIAASGMIALRGKAVAASYDTRDESRIAAEREEHDVDAEKLKQAMGLAPTATEDEVLAAVEAARKAQLAGETPPAPEGDPPAPEGDPAPAEGDPPPAAEPADIAADGTVTLDKETFELLKRGAEAGIAADAREKKSKRDQVIEAAVKAGKIPPSRRDHWGKLYDNDPEGTTSELEKLQAGALPVGIEAGVAGNGEESADDSSYPDNWFPDAVERRKAIEAGTYRQPGTIMNERSVV